MELTHDFHVSVPIERAWAVLTDLERIAPCMPGAQLLEVEGDEYKGVVKVKVGPITAQYRGTAKFVDLNTSTHRAVLRAEGRDSRGQGAASATVTATLEESDSGTAVHIETELEVSGKVAQFGRGVLGEVSEKILDQFVSQLEANVLSEGEPASDVAEDGPSVSGSSKAAAASTRSDRRVIDSPSAAPVDLLDAAGTSVFKRVVPLAIGLVLITLLRRLRRRR
jgi:carbon monoxide dehydrogenase subunit G